MSYPGARRPDRSRRVETHGLGIAVWEWGEETAPPVLLAHGGMDFAGTFDLFAPLLADAGWRVVSWDHRGHGDSDHAVLYSWDADLRDALAVLDTVTQDPVPFIGHSKGGNITLQLAEACPHRVSHVVNIDGLPSRNRAPDVADHERTKLLAGELSGWLDFRRRTVDRQRRPGTLRELAERRRQMNPRLPVEWLEYIATIGAREDEDGWRWKIDPMMRFGGFGPWRPEWALERLPGLPAPLLAFFATEPEPMGWSTTPEIVAPYMPADARIEVMQGAGHFIHVEQPAEVAAIVAEFLS